MIGSEYPNPPVSVLLVGQDLRKELIAEKKGLQAKRAKDKEAGLALCGSPDELFSKYIWTGLSQAHVCEAAGRILFDLS